YLNSRTKIEGWDIELVFRRLAARLRPLAAAALALLLLLPVALQAQQTPPGQTTEEVETALQEILAKPEFKEHSRTQQLWIPNGAKETGTQGSMRGDPRWLGWLFYGIVSAVVAIFLGWGIRWLILNKHLFRGGAGRVKVTQENGPRVVMGLDITSESLPGDIVKAARTAWAKGQLREALSLLYRGSLSRLVEQRRLPIRDSDTEDDCLLQVAGLGDAAVTDFFRPLTLAWVRAAYAGQEAGETEFEILCRTWPFAPVTAHAKPRQRVFASVAMALLLLPFLTGCDGGHWEEVTLPLGYKGEARTNPFLAAQQLLEVYGHEAERLPTLKELPDAWDGVVVVSGESGMPEARARQLLDWAHEGGHLIYTVAGCAPYSDWGMFSEMASYAYTGNEDRADPVLEALGVKVESADNLKALIETLQENFKPEQVKPEKKEAPQDATAPKPKESPTEKPAETEDEKSAQHEPADVPTLRSKMEIGPVTYEVDFVDVLKLSLNRSLAPEEEVSGTVEQATALSLVHGDGRVTVLNHARPLRNRYLDENDHARWLLALVGDEPRSVQFIVTLQSSFWNLLWTRAWMPLIGLALLTVIWLWVYMPRFGPMRQVVLHDTKHFAEHIGALGQFFYRMQRPDILLGAAADAVRARALRLHPHLGNLDDEALVQMLAPISLIPPERIRAALKPPGKVPGHEMVRLLQDLQMLKTALG
ncbi:MAG TPA: hypothetical protein DCP71_16370, partial [Verrucomicrobiales bacterium]|nr:hypothetical protein [Verrucomicrobiales bacterium]